MKTIFNAMPLNQYFKGKFHKKGFTLIELLIVVAIISILTGIGATRYQEVIKRGRDAQRKSDLRSVATALEQYYGDRSAYPIEDPGVSGGLYCFSTTTSLLWGTRNFECDFGAGLRVYSGTLPHEPTGTNEYYYEARNVSDTPCTTENDCQRYVLAAVLENDNDPEITPGCLPGYNFCVHNP